jgi:hypothetical protein
MIPDAIGRIIVNKLKVIVLALAMMAETGPFSVSIKADGYEGPWEAPKRDRDSFIGLSLACKRTYIKRITSPISF